MFQLVTQQSGTLCTTLIIPLSSVIGCLTHPQKWESCITYISSLHQLLSKSITECDNVLFIHCKLPIKVLPSICIFCQVVLCFLKYTLIPVVVGLSNKCRHDLGGGEVHKKLFWLIGDLLLRPTIVCWLCRYRGALGPSARFWDL